MAESSAQLCRPGQDCAILFARAPAPGRVKSRLWTHLTPEQACRFHCASVNDTAELLDQALPAGIPRWIFFSEQFVPDSDGARDLRLPSAFRSEAQEEGNLGERMSAAFLRAFASGARRVVIFGSDSPTLPAATARQAFDLLDQADVAFGPAEDGGYYMIGCRRFDPELFRAVEWSTRQSFQQTLANAQRLGYEAAFLQPWFDLDQWQDVERLLADARRGIPLPKHLAAFLSQVVAKST
jgi:hypothetical protein